MDFLIRYGLLLWLVIALVCLALGVYLTKAKRPRLLEPPRWSVPLENITFSHTSHLVCLGCNERTDDPNACFCGSCGKKLPQNSARKRLRATETVLVNEKELAREIHSMKRRRHAE